MFIFISPLESYLFRKSCLFFILSSIIHELEKHMPGLLVENICLDSAMGNYPIYRLLKNRGIRAFIDINDKCGCPKTIPDTITIDKDGNPLCREKLRMKPNGYDRSTGYLIWRCPYGKKHCSKCKNSCQDSKYGRVVKTWPEWGCPPRYRCLVRRAITNALPRNVSTTASSMITACTACSYTQRSIFFRTTMIGICIHLDARYKQRVKAAA